MAGYCGYSMSNNAVEAYRSGEKPKSKWTKREIIEEVKRQIEEDETELDVSLSDIEKMPVVALRDLALHEASWHHTSGYYNETSFYSVDASEITESDIEDWRPPEKIPQTAHRAKVRYTEWWGSRNYPRRQEIEECGVIKDNWFYPDKGLGKNDIHGKWFEIIEYEEKNYSSSVFLRSRPILPGLPVGCTYLWTGCGPDVHTYGQDVEREAHKHGDDHSGGRR